jgi:hypothetical protein
MKIAVRVTGMLVLIMGMFVVVGMLMIVMIMLPGIIMVLSIAMMRFVAMRVGVTGFGVLIEVMRRWRGLETRVLDNLALDAFAIAAAARVAVPRAATAGAVLGFFLRLAMGAFVGFDQRLAIGDRNLVIIRMNFAEGEKAVTVAAIFDESRLQGRLHARDLGEIDVAA